MIRSVRAGIHPVRADAVALVLVCLVSVVTWLPRLHGPIDLRWDGAAYYILGTSLAHGTGYRLLNEPGEIESVLHPPFLPALVALHQFALGTDDWAVVGVWLRRSFFVCFVLYGGAAYLMLRGYLPPLCALALTGVVVLHYGSQFLSDLLFAEIPFALASALFFVGARRDRPRAYPFLTGLAAIVAYSLRTVGIALLAVWVSDAILNRQFRTAAVRLAVALVPVLAWQGYIAHVQSRPAYRTPAYEYQRSPYNYPNVTYATNTSLRNPFSPELGQASVRDVVRRFVRNLTRIPMKFGEAVSSKDGFWDQHYDKLNTLVRTRILPPWTVWSVLASLGCMVIAGALIQLARRQWLLPLYTTLYVALMCLTPFPQQFGRYLIPISPVLVLWLVIPLRLLIGRAACHLPKLPVESLVALAIVPLLLFQTSTLVLIYRDYHPSASYLDRAGIRADYRLFFYHPSYRALDAALDWLREHADPHAVLAAADPHWAYVRTGRKAVLPPFELEPSQAQHLLDTVPVRYLILQAGAAIAVDRFTAPVLERYPQGWQPVALPAQAGVTVYERTRRPSVSTGHQLSPSGQSPQAAPSAPHA